MEVVQKEENGGKLGTFMSSFPCGHGQTCEVNQTSRLGGGHGLGLEIIFDNESNRALGLRRDLIIPEEISKLWSHQSFVSINKALLEDNYDHLLTHGPRMLLQATM